MLGLLSQMVTRWTTPATSEAVEAVVRRCCKRVIDRVGRTPLTMPSTEARGYIRALAISIVREHLDFVLEQEFPSLMSKRDALLQTSWKKSRRSSSNIAVSNCGRDSSFAKPPNARIFRLGRDGQSLTLAADALITGAAEAGGRHGRRAASSRRERRCG